MIRPNAVLYSATEMPCASSAGLVPPVGRLRAEDLDHADHGAEQAEQRRRRGDGAQRVEVALEPVHRGAAGGLERVAQRRPR